VVACIVFSFKKNFFLRDTRDGSEAFSGADQSRARSFRVHRRPLTGSTAGITPVLSGGLSGEKNEKKKTSAKNTELEKLIGDLVWSWERGRGLDL